MKTKALISCAVTAQLICVFVFAYAKSRFSHDEAQIRMDFSPFQKKKDPKPTVTTLSSGKPSQEPHEVDSVPPAAFQVDESVQSLVNGFNGFTFTRDTQTETLCVNNSAQTDKYWCVQLFDRLFERIDQVENKVIERLVSEF